MAGKKQYTSFLSGKFSDELILDILFCFHAESEVKEFVDSFPLGDAVEEIKKSQSTLSLTGMSKRRSSQISLVHHVGIEVVKTAIFIKRVFMVRAREH